ncbi:thiamine phosphate synthase [Dongia sp.]|uniref:thiamine phosphate synthase n=1 Tax=Dongia sp. TaxID=1977262 RepID=UPI0035B02DC0
MSAFAERLAMATEAADIACLRIAGNDWERITTIAKSLLPAAQERGVAVLLDDADLAVKLQADGVHLGDASTYAKARRAIGTSGIVGVACPLERHTAMEVGEAGADYVAFAPGNAPDGIDLVAWWTEMMTVPSVITGDFDAGSAAAFIAAGADFLAPSPAIWSVSDPVAAIAALIPQ